MKVVEIRPFIRNVQRLETRSTRKMGRVVPCDNRLFFCSEGQYTIEVGGEYVKLTKGGAIIIPSGTPYTIPESEEECATLTAINFDYTFNHSSLKFPIVPVSASSFKEENLVERVTFSDAEELNAPLYLARVHRVENKLGKIYSAFTKKVIYYEIEISSILSQVIIECLRCVKLNALNRRDSVFDNVFEYIHENCHLKLSNSDIAEVFGYNSNYISDLLKISTGFSLHKYLLNVRIEKAIELLEGGSKPIGEIAEECGFYDIYHFSKAFKAATGVAPTKYRKS